jgi:hypothetical protein
MKRVLPIIFVIALLSAGFLYFTQNREQEHDIAQPKYADVEDIVEACAEAMGGADIVEGIQTLRLTQNWPDHGALHTEIRRPNMERLGESLVWNGSYCVQLNPLAPIPEEEWKDNEIDIAWNFPAFFDYQAEYLGARIVNGVQTYRVEVTLPLGAVMTYYIDVETDLVLKVAANFTLYGQAHYAERVYSDHRAVDGFIYPHRFTYAGRDGTSRLTATVERLEINLPLEGRFSIPR